MALTQQWGSPPLPAYPSVPEYHLSQEVASLKRSVMRQLLKVIAEPGVISLAGGLPASELLPVETFRQCLDQVLRSDGAAALQYAPPSRELQEWIANYMQTRGVRCPPEQVFITSGAQQGLALLSRLFLDAGDTAVIEAITFTGIQQVTAGRGVKVRTVPTDLNTGVDVEALAQAFAQEPRPQLAILIPDFHNPLGVSISREKRQQVAELAATYGVPIVEDDPYSPLRFGGEALPPIRSFDDSGHVFYLGSFSKMLAPALRLGWIIIPPELLPKITVLRESIDLESSTLMQRAVARFVTGGFLEDHLRHFNQANQQRYQALRVALEQHLGDIASWTTPQGGLFSWVTLPPALDTWQLLEKAIARKVAYVPGSAFTVAGSFQHTLRLNFSSVRPERIPDAVSTLAQVFRSAI